MKILKKLNSELPADDKLTAINKFVTKVRVEYGNDDVEISPVKVHTTEGYVPLSLLTSQEKVAVGTQEIRNAVAQATIITEDNEGAKFDRVIGGIVAINAILSNLDAESDSQY